MPNEKKKIEKKNVKDDFYDRINYYESRNIFSTNEAFDPGNRLYTDQASLTHGVWDKINKSSRYHEEEIQDEKPKQNMDSALAKSQFTQNLLSSITKLSGISNNAPIGCSKCGYVGHLPYMCRNNFKVKTQNGTGIFNSLFSNLDNGNAEQKYDKENEDIKSKENEQKNNNLEKNSSNTLSNINQIELEMLVKKELEKLDKHKGKKDKNSKKTKKNKKEKKSKKDKKYSERKSRSRSSSISRKKRSYSRSRSNSRDRSKIKK